jgi:hypothetical protein
VELLSPCSSLLLRSTGSSLAFPGYLAAWQGIGSSSSSSADSPAAAAAAAAGELSEVEDDDVAALAGPKGSALSKVLQQLQEGQLVALMKVRDGVFFSYCVNVCCWLSIWCRVAAMSAGLHRCCLLFDRRNDSAFSATCGYMHKTCHPVLSAACATTTQTS